jgi:hypothetical protein
MASMTNQLAALILPLRDLFEPLLDRISTLESLEYLFHRYGWRVVLDDTAFAAIGDGLQVKAALADLLALIGPLQQKLDGDGDLGADDVASLARALNAVIQAISSFSVAATGGLPAPLDDEAFWQDVATHLFDDLLEEYLRIQHPAYYLVLHAAGVLDYRATAPDGPFRRAYTRIVFDWPQIGALIDDPIGALKKTYRWGLPDQPFDHARAIDVLERVLRALRLPIDRRLPGLDVASLPASAPYRIQADADALQTTLMDGVLGSDRVKYELGLALLVAAKQNEPVASGMILNPVVRGGAEGSIPLGDLLLKWKAALSLGEVLGIAVFPDTVGLAGGEAALGASVAISDPRTGPTYVFGNAHTSRLEVTSPSIELSISGAIDDPEVRLRIGAGGANGQPGGRLVVPIGEADSFVQDSVRKDALDLSFSPEVIWSSRTGLTFNGKASLDVDVPINTSFGGVRIHDLRLTLARSGTPDPIFELEASTGLDVQLGPVAASIDRIGLRVGFDFAAAKKNLGFVDLAFGFKPPSGIGVAIDAPSVSGGGYLFLDTDKGQYAGVVQLTIQDRIAVTAIGLITTRLPSGAPGFSFLVIITADDFQPIPLGLGFSLTGIGGIVAVNRTCDEEFLREGLKNQTLNDVLFPADPIKSAAHILGTFDRAFPARAGSFLFGPVAQISWGTPPLLTMDLGVVLELGNRTRLIVLGRVAAILPNEKDDLLRLQMNALGIIDVDQERIAVDAVLYDSRLVGKFPITGSMAMRVSWGADRVLALSIGGFHPAFRPPPAFPVLDRLAITFSNSSDFKLRAESYFAITSNTLQFGAKVDLYASAGGFAIAGLLGYDVLIQFDPFAFTADLYASVQLKYHSHNLFKVSVAGQLSGPRPLHVRGKATFEIFWCDVSVSFDKTLVSGERPPAIPPVNVTPQLIAALNDGRNWGGQLAAGDRGVVTLRAAADPAAIALHALGTLSVTQTIVPLDLDIARFGNATPSDAHRFSIAAVRVNGAPVAFQRVHDFFAPAQFLDLSDVQKLAAPAFEQMVAGVSVGLAGVQFTNNDADILEDESITYETILVDDAVSREAPAAAVSADFVKRYVPLGAAATSDIRRVGEAKYRVDDSKSTNTMTPSGWAIVSRDDGSAQSVAGIEPGQAASYAASIQALAALARTNPARARTLMLVRSAQGDQQR